MNDTIRIAGIVNDSIVDGPGLRYTIFAQGCPHACPGCHNPETHDPAGGYDFSFSGVLAAVKKNALLRGVTFSGGEPVLQSAALAKLAGQIKAENSRLDFLLYSGYTFEELFSLGGKNPAILSLLSACDVLIDGRFEKDKRSLDLLFRGSKNQRAIDLRASLKAGVSILFEF